MRIRGVAILCAVLAVFLVAPGVRAPPLPPYVVFGHALDAAGGPLPVGSELRAFIDGVAYPDAAAVTATDGSYQLSVVGNSYAGSVSDTPQIKEGGDPGDFVVFAQGDLTANGAMFVQAGSWQPGSASAQDLRMSDATKQPAALKIQTIVARPADAGTQYAFVCPSSSGVPVDLSRYYLQKDIVGSFLGPTVPLSGLVAAGATAYVDLGSSSFLVSAGDVLKLVWRNPGGAGAPASGADVPVDRVEFNATSAGTLTWEPGNTILTDAVAPGLGEELRRVPACADTDSGGDLQVGPETGRRVPPSVQLQTPSGGEDWTGGSPHDLRFTASDATDGTLSVEIALSTDGGLTFPIPIDGPAARPVGTHSVAWTVPMLDTTTARVRVCATNSKPLTNCAASGSDFAIDSTKPVVVAVWPPPGATDVRLNEPIRIRFSETMNRTSSQAAFSMSPRPDPLSFSWTATGGPDDALVVNHPDLATVATYTVVLAASARDSSDPGNSLASGTSLSFATSDNHPPQATAIGPGACLSGGFDHRVTWTISDPETPTSSLVVYVNYTSSAGGGALVGPALGVTSTTWLVPTGLNAPDVRIVVQVFDPRGANRTVGGPPFEVDSTPPRVVSTSPSEGSAGVSRSQLISLTFSEAMNRTATEGAVQVSPSGGILTFTWSNTTLLVGHSALRYNTTYRVTISTVARDDCTPGARLGDPYTLEFATQGNAPPAVRIEEPAGGSSREPASRLRIAWNMSDDRTPSFLLVVFVNYSSSSGNGTIADGTGLTNASWTVPALDAPDVQIEVTVVDDGGLQARARSDAFSVRPRGFVITDYLWIILIAAAVVAIAAILVSGRRRQRREAGAGSSKGIDLPRGESPAAGPTEPSPSPARTGGQLPPGRKECPSCHAPVAASASFCFRCGHNFRTPPQSY